MAKYKNELLEKRYKFNSGIIMQAVRSNLKWADGKAIKNEVDVQVTFSFLILSYYYSNYLNKQNIISYSLKWIYIASIWRKTI